VEQGLQLVAHPNNFIGKEPMISDKEDPLGQKTSVEYKQSLAKYKLLHEHHSQASTLFYSTVERAVNWYKKTRKSHRTIQYIIFHLSEMQTREGVHEEARDYRKRIFASLVKDGWAAEAVVFLELAKQNAKALGNNKEYFLNEMEILNYDKSKTAEEKRERFVALLQNAADIGEANIHMTGGDLIVVKAHFKHPQIQINHYNKVELEIHSHLPMDLRIDKVGIKFNEKDLSFAKEEQVVIKAGGEPFTLEKDLFIGFDMSESEFIILQQVAIKVGDLEITMQPVGES